MMKFTCILASQNDPCVVTSGLASGFNDCKFKWIGYKSNIFSTPCSTDPIGYFSPWYVILKIIPTFVF